MRFVCNIRIQQEQQQKQEQKQQQEQQHCFPIVTCLTCIMF